MAFKVQQTENEGSRHGFWWRIYVNRRKILRRLASSLNQSNVYWLLICCCSCRNVLVTQRWKWSGHRAFEPPENDKDVARTAHGCNWRIAFVVSNAKTEVCPNTSDEESNDSLDRSYVSTTLSVPLRFLNTHEASILFKFNFEIRKIKLLVRHPGEHINDMRGSI